MTGHDAALVAVTLLDRQETNAAVARLRGALRLGVLLWLLGFALDAWLASVLAPESAARVAWIRVLCGLVPLAALLSVGSASVRWIRALELASFASVVCGQAAIALHLGGLGGAYTVSVPVILAYRGVWTIESWRRGVPKAVLLALCMPCCALLLRALEPAVATQFESADALSRFAIACAFTCCWGGIMVAASHGVWAMQRRVFENRSIGKYRLRRLIGQGATGDIWAAYHSGLKREVALKILRRHWLNDPSAVERFEREVEMTARLTHANTVRVFDYGVSEDGIPFIAMELLSGRDLARELEAVGRLAPARSVQLWKQIVGAAADAHGHGIVHRDLKPANVWLMDDVSCSDLVKVLDFGLARPLQEVGSRLTAAGTVLGTPGFIAPEVLLRGEGDMRADVYALGAIAYQMLTGQPPVDTRGGLAGMLGSLERDIEPPSAHGVVVDGSLERLIMRCLAREPDERFADAGALAEALGALPLTASSDTR